MVAAQGNHLPKIRFYKCVCLFIGEQAGSAERQEKHSTRSNNAHTGGIAVMSNKRYKSMTQGALQ